MSRPPVLLTRPRRPPAVISAQDQETAVHDTGRHRRRSVGRGDLVTAWVMDRLPMPLRGRTFIGGRELGLIALIAAVALCMVAGIALRSKAAAIPPKKTAVVSAPAAPRPIAGAPLVSKKGVVVDVAGAVAHPGIVTLPPGSRVFEALKAAGGAKRGVDISALNLARVLVDGEQIVVGRAAQAMTSAQTATSGLVSLNQATESQLEDLPGIGPTMAKNIVAWRAQHGGFSKVEDLQEVSGIGPKTFAKLKPLVSL